MNQETIKRFIKEAHQNAIDLGFYDCPECGGICLMKYHLDIPNYYSQRPDDKCRNCKGTGIDPNKNIGELLMLIVSELGEALEAHRRGRFADKAWMTFVEKWRSEVDDDKWAVGFEEKIKDTFEDEIADVFIRLFDLCGYFGIDLEYKSIDKESSQLSDSRNIGESLIEITKCILEIHMNDQKTFLDFEESISSLIDLCDRLNIPIQKHIEAKMAYNKTRPRLHGKEY